MNDRKLLRTGVIGSAIAAICCFTPALVILFAAAGLSPGGPDGTYFQ